MGGHVFGRPFALATALAALFAAAHAEFPAGSVALQQALAVLPPYESRGKGGKRAHRKTGIAAQRRAARKARNVRRNRRAHRA